MPCCAKEEYCDEEVHSCTEEKSQASEDESGDVPCSPFYSCGACTGFNVIAFQLVKKPFHIEKTLKFHSKYHPGASEPYPLSLLKPPKQN